MGGKRLLFITTITKDIRWIEIEKRFMRGKRNKSLCFKHQFCVIDFSKGHNYQ